MLSADQRRVLEAVHNRDRQHLGTSARIIAHALDLYERAVEDTAAGLVEQEFLYHDRHSRTRYHITYAGAAAIDRILS